MLCERCHKREATVIEEIIFGNQKKILHLCEECTERADPLASLIIGLFTGQSKPMNIKQGEPGLDDRCPSCGTSLREIQTGKVVRIGCGDCYRFFKKKLYPLIAACQKGATKHIGKKPGQVKPITESIESPEIKPLDPIEEKRKLEAELEKAVQAEEFEKAAGLRDKIREIDLALVKSQI